MRRTAFEATFSNKRQEHMYIEPNGSLAIPEPDGGVTIYVSIQCPYYVQKAVARALGTPLETVRVIQAVTGGAFGGKEEVPSEICALSAVGAVVTRRPVKIIYEREDDVLRSSKRHPVLRHMRSARMRMVSLWPFGPSLSRTGSLCNTDSDRDVQVDHSRVRPLRDSKCFGKNTGALHEQPAVWRVQGFRPTAGCICG